MKTAKPVRKMIKKALHHGRKELAHVKKKLEPVSQTQHKTFFSSKAKKSYKADTKKVIKEIAHDSHLDPHHKRRMSHE